jgi:peptide/nickel transport system substrate-binding protein
VIGTGPYKIDSVSPQAITMKKNPSYWGKLAAGAPAKVTVRTSTEAATRVAALESKEAQIAFDIPPELASRVPKTVVTPALEMVNWRLNGVSGLTQDVRVRKALVLGTDRELIRKTVVGDKYSGACTGNDVPRGVFGFNPNLPNPPYDPAQAKQLLTEAGAMGKTVELVGSSRYAKSIEGTQALAQQIEKLGLKVKLQIRDTQAWLNVLYAGKKNTVGIVLHGAGSETWDALATYSKGPAPGSPISEFPDKQFPLFGKYLREAAVTIDDRAREALLFKVGEQFANSYNFICGWTPSSVYGAGKNVSWAVRRDNQIEFSTVTVG